MDRRDFLIGSGACALGLAVPRTGRSARSNFSDLADFDIRTMIRLSDDCLSPVK
jgi:hypothetical protein